MRVKDLPGDMQPAFQPFPGSQPNVCFKGGRFYEIERGMKFDQPPTDVASLKTGKYFVEEKLIPWDDLLVEDCNGAVRALQRNKIIRLADGSLGVTP